MNENQSSGWVGWVFFASVLMIILGMFQALAGLTAIINNQHLLVTQSGLYLFDTTTWGWIHFLLGIIVSMAGFAAARGELWGRAVGVTLAGLSAVVNLAFITTNPLWTITIVVINVIIIYALIVHGHEAKKQSKE